MLDKTLLNGLRVVESLAGSARLRGVTELARELGISKTSTHRLLQTLASRHYVAKDEEGGGYKLTMRLWEVGAQVMSRNDVKRMGGAYLRKLADNTGESAHMTVLNGMEVVYIDKIDGRQPLRAFSPIGGRAPAYCVATGKALIAYQSEDFLRALEGELKPYTKRTITSAQALRADLARVKRLGYAVNRCEWRDNICSIGAPVFDASGSVVAGIGISGPADRLPPATTKKIGKLVAEMSRDMSAALGYQAS